MSSGLYDLTQEVLDEISARVQENGLMEQEKQLSFDLVRSVESWWPQSHGDYTTEKIQSKLKQVQKELAVLKQRDRLEITLESIGSEGFAQLLEKVTNDFLDRSRYNGGRRQDGSYFYPMNYQILRELLVLGLDSSSHTHHEAVVGVLMEFFLLACQSSRELEGKSLP